MVDRREIESRPLTVVDLDGTYISANSLIIYLRCGLTYLIKKCKLSATARLLVAVLRRKLGLSAHTQMKYVILDTLSQYPEILPNFAAEANKCINCEIRDLLDSRRSNGHRILLATAAPKFYVQKIWNGDFVATEFERWQPMIECKGIEKLKRVKEFIKTTGCHLNTVISDHIDDKPLFEYNKSGVNLLVRHGKIINFDNTSI